MTERRVDIPVLTRVEGEGALHVRLDGDRVTDLRLRIFEPPRFFEQFLVGRTWREVTDVVTRVCGICPVAYQMSAAHAIEKAFGVTITPDIRALRRLYYSGEWLESHSLHVHLLAAPDFFGYPSAIAMAKDYPEEVRRGMRLQGLGNDIVKMFGGRSVNPVGIRAGGFYRVPSRSEARALLKRVRALLPDAEALVRWTAALDLPDVRRKVPYVSLRHPQEYPMNEGNIISSIGHDFTAEEFPDHIREHQVPHSNALQARLDGQNYWTNPQPRLNNNLDRLPPAAAQLLAETGLSWPSDNPYHSIIARAVEIHVAILEAERVLAAYDRPPQPNVDVTPRAGVGAACTEAPRGILWHRYEFDDEGKVTAATLIPPTSQNQGHMEDDMRQSILESLTLDDERLKLRLESGIRNYDPCISCSAHFLQLDIERR